MRFTFTKQERLKSKKIIEQLFKEGKSVSVFPLKLVFIKIEHQGSHPIQMGISVPKKRIKKAVARNGIKRLIREAYRHHKSHVYSTLNEKYAIMIIYTDEKAHKYVFIKDKMISLLEKFVKKVTEKD